MYFSVGSNEIKKNFLDIYARKNNLGNLTTNNANKLLKKSYIQTVKPLIPIKIEDLNNNNHILRINDPLLCSKLSAGYNMSKLDDLSQSDIISNTIHDVSKEEVDIYFDSIDFIKSLSIDLYEVFQLAINVIFFMRSDEASGGSTSGMPGVIWVNPKPHWCIKNRVEFLIHELTHNLLFIEEIIRDLYSYKNMYKKEYWTRSAVLNKSRPLDKSFHSAVVGTEIILFRNNYSAQPDNYYAHPPTQALIQQTLYSLESCLASPLLKPRGKEILESCLNKLEAI